MGRSRSRVARVGRRYGPGADAVCEAPKRDRSAGVAELELVAYRGELPKVGAGKPVLLFFWATWCKACKAVVPELLAMARERNLEVLAITDDSEANLERFFAVPREFPSAVARDLGRQLVARVGVRVLPTFVLLDGQGRVASPLTSRLRELATPSNE